MRVLVIGSTGTIGKAIVAALPPSHEVIAVSRHSDPAVDIRDVESISSMYARVGRVDAVLCAAGSGAWKPLGELTDADFALTLAYKLMGQVNVIRHGLASVRDGGSITVTSGVLSHVPTTGGAAISLVNGGLDAFARAAAIEAPRGIRVNVVSPPWVSETLAEMGSDPSTGLPAAVVAQAYLRTLTGSETGQVIEPR